MNKNDCYFRLFFRYTSFNSNENEEIHFYCKKYTTGTHHCIGTYPNVIYNADTMHFSRLPAEICDYEQTLISVAETERAMLCKA